jgi:hypothetical protein
MRVQGRIGAGHRTDQAPGPRLDDVTPSRPDRRERIVAELRLHEVAERGHEVLGVTGHDLVVLGPERGIYVVHPGAAAHHVLQRGAERLLEGLLVLTEGEVDDEHDHGAVAAGSQDVQSRLVIRQVTRERPEPALARIGAEVAHPIAHPEETRVGHPGRVHHAPVRRRERLVLRAVKAADEQGRGRLIRVTGVGHDITSHGLLEGGRHRGGVQLDVAYRQVPHGRAPVPTPDQVPATDCWIRTRLRPTSWIPRVAGPGIPD